MAKFLTRDSSTGRVAEKSGVTTGGTAGQSGEIPQLDSTGRLDSTVMPVGIGGDTYSGTAAEGLTAGDFVSIQSDGQVVRASAASGGRDAIGFVLASVTASNAVTVYLEGRNTSLTGLTAGSRYYLSDSSPGGFTATPVAGAGKRHQFLGVAVTSTSLSFEGDDGIALL
jgi:hypothetical protein